MAKKIYIASKTKHADKWIKLRQVGVNIISTWIDFADKTKDRNLLDISERCINESNECDVMIVYAEKDEVLKGALLEMGIALGRRNVNIFLVGPVLSPTSAFLHDKNIYEMKSMESAIELVNRLA